MEEELKQKGIKSTVSIRGHGHKTGWAFNMPSEHPHQVVHNRHTNQIPGEANAL